MDRTDIREWVAFVLADNGIEDVDEAAAEAVVDYYVDHDVPGLHVELKGQVILLAREQANIWFAYDVLRHTFAKEKD